jgi:endoglycosylceramidase
VDGVPLCRFDFGQMRRLGYDAIRLNLSWSLLEPKPGEISGQYLDRIAQVVGWAKKRGIYVVLDMHQDAWSKFVYTRGESCEGELRPIRGFDGAPLWASKYSSPACASRGVRDLDPAVAEQFQKFWANADGLQDHYTDVLTALARRFHAEPAVAGYELMNEPQPGSGLGPRESDARELFPYWGRAIDTVVARVKGFRQLFFVEPNVERNVTDRREPPPARWSAYSSYRHVVYAPHVYTGVFTAGQEIPSESFQPTVQGYQATVEDARALGLPLWIGEFGNNPSDDGTLLPEHYALQDVYKLGGALWVWKQNSSEASPNVFWGVYGPPFGRGVPERKRILMTGRVTPVATAGQLDNVSYAPRHRTFDIRARAGKRVSCSDRRHATLVFVPPHVNVRVKGARMKAVGRGGGRDVYVFPDGGAYRVFAGHGKKRTCSKK